jgi:hypothetical protein
VVGLASGLSSPDAMPCAGVPEVRETVLAREGAEVEAVDRWGLCWSGEVAEDGAVEGGCEWDGKCGGCAKERPVVAESSWICDVSGRCWLVFEF